MKLDLGVWRSLICVWNSHIWSVRVINRKLLPRERCFQASRESASTDPLLRSFTVTKQHYSNIKCGLRIIQSSSFKFFKWIYKVPSVLTVVIAVLSLLLMSFSDGRYGWSMVINVPLLHYFLFIIAPNYLYNRLRICSWYNIRTHYLVIHAWPRFTWIDECKTSRLSFTCLSWKRNELKLVTIPVRGLALLGGPHRPWSISFGTFVAFVGLVSGDGDEMWRNLSGYVSEKNCFS